jgi:hypothetical protein
MAVSTAGTIHPNDAAVCFYKQSPIVIELPIMSQWTIKCNSASVLPLKLPAKTPARNFQIDSVKEKFTAVKKNSGRARILNDAWELPNRLTSRTNILTDKANSLVIGRFTTTSTTGVRWILDLLGEK